MHGPPAVAPPLAGSPFLAAPCAAIGDVPASSAWGAIVFGAALVIGGILLFRWHRRSWNTQRGDTAATERDLHHFHRQYLRRTQVAVMLVLLGVLIPLGVTAIDWRPRPGWWAAYWLFVLALTLWMACLAVGDMLSQRAYAMAELAKVRRRHRELEDELLEHRSRANNGRRE
ncbi:MAG: hypothetical protein WD066_19365 [Planctomycetaceae bacterium]